MASNNETTTKFKVDISELKSAMQEAKRQISVTNSEFKAISSTMDDWSKSSDGISAKLKQLNTNLSSQKTVLSALERQYELTVEEMGEGSAEADRLKIAINNQKAVVNGTQKEINKWETALDEVGKAEDDTGKEADDLGEDLNDLEKNAKDTSEGFTVFKGVLANLVTDGLRAVASGCKSAVSALGGMVKESVQAYAEYEQLVGGVDTLFKDSSKKVQEYADNAYKTAGMSANDYMSTVTSFSASLLSALGGDTAKSAEVADMAITDMSDNANKMGTDISSIQNAYQGFAKQNYTMLDNLKLGYGGTKEEMERLLADASKLSGQEYDISNLNDVIQAIHVVQTELDISGTTAKEASTTIEGSVASMKSAWSNLLAGMANENADFGQLVTNLVDSVSTMLSNILPRVTQAISGVGQLISKLAPIISAELPKMISEILPVLLEALGSLLKAVLSALQDVLPTLISAVLEVLTLLVDLITDPNLLNTLIEGAIQLFLGILQALPVIITKLAEAIPTIINSITTALCNPDTIAQIIDASITVLMAIVDAIPIIAQALVEALPVIITTIITIIFQLIPKLISFYGQVLTKVKEWLSTLLAKVGEGAQNIVNKVVEWIKQLPDEIWTWLVKTIAKVTTWSINLAQKGKEAGEKLVKTFIDNVKKIPDKMKSIGSDIVKGLWNGINDMTSWIKEKIKGFGDSVVSGLKDFFGIHSPSKLMADEIGKFIPEGIAVGIDKNAKSVMKAMKDLTANTLTATTQGLSSSSAMSGVTGGVVNNYTQIINSPKELSRLDIYRQSKNLLVYSGGGF